MDDVAGTGISVTQIVIALGVLAAGVGLALVARLQVMRAFHGSDSSPGAANLIARLSPAAGTSALQGR